VVATHVDGFFCGTGVAISVKSTYISAALYVTVVSGFQSRVFGLPLSDS
jgi:hypothetical protein